MWKVCYKKRRNNWRISTKSNSKFGNDLLLVGTDLYRKIDNSAPQWSLVSNSFSFTLWVPFFFSLFILYVFKQWGHCWVLSMGWGREKENSCDVLFLCFLLLVLWLCLALESVCFKKKLKNRKFEKGLLVLVFVFRIDNALLRCLMMKINNLPDHVMPLTCFDSLAQVYHENVLCWNSSWWWKLSTYDFE